jgi:hypothetical protein
MGVSRAFDCAALGGTVFSLAVVREPDATVWAGLWRSVFFLSIRKVTTIASIAMIGATLRKTRRFVRDWRSI